VTMPDLRGATPLDPRRARGNTRERASLTSLPTAYDVAGFRAHFPALADGAAHFDGPGGSQTPDVVGAAISRVLTGPLSNRGRMTVAERNADHAVTEGRSAVADFLNADPRGVIFGRSMTALTFELARAMAKDWRPGDEVVVSRLDHDANVRPWVIAAQAAGVEVRWVAFDPATGELDPAAVAAQLSPRTRVVAVTGASNLVGTRPDLPAIANAVHAVGGWLYVDGVHLAPHTLVDMVTLGADFFACSPYKFLGPHCGVVAGRPALLETLRPDKLVPSSDAIPERFELGTLPYELLAGTTAAIDFLADAVPGEGDRRTRLQRSMAVLEAHEDGLRALVENALLELPGATVHSRAVRRTPTLLVTFAGHEPADLYRRLAERGVNVPAGTFYAYEPARHLDLWPAGGLRIGIAPYTDQNDVDRLLGELTTIVRLGGSVP
jgi:cysteine desulfurase family protein (TIGR01976 family)